MPLSGMPPAFGAAGLRYLSAANYRPWVEVAWRYYASQDRLSASDLVTPDVRNGSIPGFDVFHIRSGFSLTDRVSVTAALENVFNKKYREFGSTIFAPGREVVLGTQFRF